MLKITAAENLRNYADFGCVIFTVASCKAIERVAKERNGSGDNATDRNTFQLEPMFMPKKILLMMYPVHSGSVFSQPSWIDRVFLFGCCFSVCLAFKVMHLFF